MTLDISRFRFKTSVQVRHYEVDWQGVVHNANYLLYLESGRVSYLQHLGVQIDLDAIRNQSRIVVVRNEIDYRSPAQFGEVLDVFTRISYIRNSSFGFEGILEGQTTGRRVAEGSSVLVWLDQETGKPARVEDWIRKATLNYEGDNVLIEWPPQMA